VRRLGIKLAHYGPHALRHACATHLLAQGLSLKQIGDHLGHRSAQATRIYAKVDVSSLRQVADQTLAGLVECSEPQRQRKHKVLFSKLSSCRCETWRILVGRCAMRLGSAIQEYTDYKRSLGMDFRTDATRLRAFLRQTGDVEIDSISAENVQAYLEGRGGPGNVFLVQQVSCAGSILSLCDWSAPFGTPAATANDTAQAATHPRSILVLRRRSAPLVECR